MLLLLLLLFLLLLFPLFNYSGLNCDPSYEMIHHPRAVLGLGDGGAHCGAICDASMTTSLLSHWARDRHRGEKLPLEFCVRKMTKDTATLYGMQDRGVLAPGMKGEDVGRLPSRYGIMDMSMPSMGGMGKGISDATKWVGGMPKRAWNYDAEGLGQKIGNTKFW